jgi:hypothetical protein
MALNCYGSYLVLDPYRISDPKAHGLPCVPRTQTVELYRTLTAIHLKESSYLKSARMKIRTHCVGISRLAESPGE